MTYDPRVIAKIQRWRADPCSFVFDNFGVTPDLWQKDALEAFVSEDKDRQRIALSACAGPGKSACLAWCALLFISCYCGEKHPVGAVISATKDVLRDTIWKEINIWRRKSKFLEGAFDQTQSKVFSRDHPDSWYLIAKTYTKSADEEEQGRTLQGLHSTHIAYFIDECGDMGVPVLKGAEQGLSNCVFGKIICAGNPTSHTGLLHYAVIESLAEWYVINISGDPEDPKRSPRIGIEQARNMILEHGRDDPWVMAYILGQFPKHAINTLLSPEEVTAAINRGRMTDVNHEMYKHSQKRLGVDVALYGDDMTVIFPRQGIRAFMPVEIRNSVSDGEAPSRIAARVMQAKNEWGSEMEFVDCGGGYGDSVVSYMSQAGADPIRTIGASTKTVDKKYYNRRTECYFLLRDWIRNGGILPNKRSLIKGLSSQTYSMKGGKLALEDKANVKVKIKRSPDDEDALSQTFWFEDMQASLSDIPGVAQVDDRQSSEWDVEY